MTVNIFYNEFVFSTQVKNHKAIKETLLPLIVENLENTKNKQLGNWFCDVNTEFFDAGQSVTKYLNLITSEIYPALDLLFQELPNLQRPKTSTVSHIWYNHYATGGTQEVHTHTKSKGHPPALSGVYLLELTEPNPLVFFSPAAASNPFVKEALKTEFAKEGTLLLFPSSMPHYVLPCTSKRTTVAFNIRCEF